MSTNFETGNININSDYKYSLGISIHKTRAWNIHSGGHIYPTIVAKTLNIYSRRWKFNWIPRILTFKRMKTPADWLADEKFKIYNLGLPIALKVLKNKIYAYFR